MGETKIKFEFHYWTSQQPAMLYFYKIHQKLRETGGNIELETLMEYIRYLTNCTMGYWCCQKNVAGQSSSVNNQLTEQKSENII